MLAARPDHPDALHLLGVTARQAGRNGAAVEWIGRAIKQNPHNPAYFCDLGMALKQQGKLDDAIAAYRRAVGLKHYVVAHSLLGHALKEHGKVDEAIASYRHALRLQSDLADVHLSLGELAYAQGKLDGAVSAFAHVVRIKPNFAEGHCNLGAALRGQGKLEGAVAAFREAIRLKPELVEAHSNLGATLRDQLKLDEAIAASRQAIVLNPNLAVAHFNLALASMALGECSNPVRLSRKPSSLRRIKPSTAAISAISQSTKTATLIWSQWNNCCKTVPGFPLMTGYIYILCWPRPMTTLAGMQKRFANGSPEIRSSGSILPTMRQRCWRHLIVHRQYSLPIWSALGKTAACHQRCRSSSWGCPAQALL